MSPLADATTQRTFVASTGSDAHACSLAQPCRSFAAAIAQTSAGGEVIVLDSAGYGSVTISKDVSIIAPAGIYAGISVVSGDGITVNAPGATVVLRGLSINGLGGTHGINLHAAGRLRVENCVISEMAQDGVHHTASGAELVMLDTIVRDNGNFGINIGADASAVLDHVRSEHNDTAGFHMAPVSNKASATVTDSVFAHNGTDGIVAESHTSSTTVTIDVERSVVSDNVGSGFVGSTSSAAIVNVALARNAISDNGGEGIALDGGGTPATVHARISENTVLNSAVGIHVVSGSAFVSANALYSSSVDLLCESGVLSTLGNNIGAVAGGCVLSTTGI